MSNVFGITARAVRWYGDGTESGSTALSSEGTSGTLNYELNNLANAQVQLRYGVQESGSGSASGVSTDDYQVQYSKNAGAYTSITAATSNVRAYNSSNVTDGNATTQRLSSGTGSFIAGEIDDNDGVVTDWQLTANNFSELLYSLEFVAADTADGDTFDFRVLRNGAVFNTYSVTPRITIQNRYTLSVERGDYSETGQTAGLRYDRRLTLDSGTHTLTGQTVTLTKVIRMAADGGSYSETGSNVSLYYNRAITSSSGSYVLTGQTASLLYGRIFPLSSGSYTLTGQNAGLYRGLVVVAANGSYTETGSNVSLYYNRVLTNGAGSDTLTGQNASLRYDRLIALVVGNYVLTGQNVTLTYTPTGGPETLNADQGSYVLSGRSATLLYRPIISPNLGRLGFLEYIMGLRKTYGA